MVRLNVLINNITGMAYHYVTLTVQSESDILRNNLVLYVTDKQWLYQNNTNEAAPMAHSYGLGLVTWRYQSFKIRVGHSLLPVAILP